MKTLLSIFIFFFFCLLTFKVHSQSILALDTIPGFYEENGWYYFPNGIDDNADYLQINTDFFESGIY